MHAAQTLHAVSFDAVIYAKQSYFDTTPVGRVLNRCASLWRDVVFCLVFTLHTHVGCGCPPPTRPSSLLFSVSGDLDLVDTRLPEVLEIALQLFNQCLLSVVVISVVFPWFLLPLIPIVATFYFITRTFRRNNRELKRLEGISRSPMVSNIQAAVSGIETIRAFGRGWWYVRANRFNVDQNTVAYQCFYTVNRWVSVRLDAVVVTIVFITGLFAVLSKDAFDAGQAGLTLVYALQMGGIFQFMTRQMSESEAMLTSVERLTVPVPPESKLWQADADPPSDVQEVAVPDDWPQHGALALDGVSVRYRDGLPLVLRSLTVDVRAGHRVGIVGRTGSGKSTLGLTLFRIVELAAGAITIDGVDIGSVDRLTLRSRLSIIPQDPILFEGTIRSNLDPFARYTDDEVWDVLEQVHLKDHVRAAPAQLGMPVTENGTNFSQGQRQLLAMGRALLKRARVVVLDEATSAADSQTDAAVQAALRQSMANCTLLIIAHRLDTIADCDRVLGLERGVVVEYGRPAALLGLVGAGPGELTGAGLFKGLVDETGPDTAAQLEGMAMQAAAAGGGAGSGAE